MRMVGLNACCKAILAQEKGPPGVSQLTKSALKVFVVPIHLMATTYPNVPGTAVPYLDESVIHIIPGTRIPEDECVGEEECRRFSK